MKNFVFGLHSIPGFHLFNQRRHDPSFHFITGPFHNPAEIAGISDHKNLATVESVAAEDLQKMCSLFNSNEPARVYYAQAVCNVGKCQQAPEWAMEMNVVAVKNLLSVLPAGSRLVYLSSDHVFATGAADEQWFDETSEPCPNSVYGATRIAAENLVKTWENHLIIRTSLLLGSSLNGRSGHLDWLKYRQQKGLRLTLIADELRCACDADAAAKRILQLGATQITGLRHLSGKRCIDRPLLAGSIADRLGLNIRFDTKKRADQQWPHPGRVAIRSIHEPPLDCQWI